MCIRDRYQRRVRGGAPTMNSELFGFLVSLGINSVLGLAFLLCFGYFRESHPDLYFKHRAASFLPAGYLAWMSFVFQSSDQELQGSPDGLAMLWMLRLLFKITSVLCVCLVTCLPANILGGHGEDGLNRLTAGNVKDGSYLLVLHASSSAICSIIALQFIGQACAASTIPAADRERSAGSFVAWRKAYLSEARPSNLFVAVRGVPEPYSKDPGSFAAELETLLGTDVEAGRAGDGVGHVSAVTLFCNTEEIRALHDQKTAIDLVLEGASKDWELESSKDPHDTERPTHRVGGLGCCGGQVVDSIDWCTDSKLPEIKASVDLIVVEDLEPLCAGVIGFTSLQMASACCSGEVPLRERAGLLEVWPAPNPDDVCWEHIHQAQSSAVSCMGDHPHWGSRAEESVVSLLLLLLSLAFSLIVVFIASMANLDSIQEKCDCIGFVDELPELVQGVIQTYTPVVILAACLMVIPGLMYTANSKANWVSHSQVTRAAIHSYYKFLFVNMFVIYLISGSIFNNMKQMFEDVGSIAPTLGMAIPSTCTFFTVFIMSAAFVGLPLRLSLLPALVIGSLKRRFLAKTDTQIAEAMALPPFDLATEAPLCLVIFCITFTYATISPIILPFALAYFALGYVVIKQQLLCCVKTGRSCMFWTAVS
eukprot:TRINITY_DN8486_c0_g3_i8.p1 TRINITY_DN8486_c0_g3~~TRINITY_DN8486_c0_g3_i8.p1  ORF type:complete len:650 (+),score=132.86 TRINITY_DN8486_c0_g3_i8:125-2074(+)